MRKIFATDDEGTSQRDPEGIPQNQGLVETISSEKVEQDLSRRKNKIALDSDGVPIVAWKALGQEGLSKGKPKFQVLERPLASNNALKVTPSIRSVQDKLMMLQRANETTVPAKCEELSPTTEELRSVAFNDTTSKFADGKAEPWLPQLTCSKTNKDDAVCDHRANGSKPKHEVNGILNAIHVRPEIREYPRRKARKVVHLHRKEKF
ncbi:unnamed protein product [Soboliphyme baturini]|uniref:CaM_binding domain-containing protein n=1 Tax=Soboliphyme baturini TaxID=241478 RepID=A0A183IKS3_9BILA|nr:unnamed protein product [Soboliphyme baturini]